MTKQKIISMILSVAAILMWPTPAHAKPAFREGVPGLDSSYSSTYSSQTVTQEFKRDLRQFDQRSEAAAAASSAPVSVPAAVEAESAPAFKFHSGFSHAAVYESNLYDTRLDPVDDLISLPTVWAGVSKGREGESAQYFETAYGLTYMDYAENDKFDHLSHTQYTQYDWRGKKLQISLQNTFSPLSPKGTANRQELRSAGASNSVIATTNDFAFKSAYELHPKWTLKNTWGHALTYYPQSASGNSRAIELQSSQVHSLAPRLEYQLTAKTTLFTAYQFETADYFKGGVLAFKSHTALAGFETQLNPKLSYLFQAGYKTKDFNQPVYDDSDLFIYGVSVRRELSPRLLLSLSLSGTAGSGLDTTDPSDVLATAADDGVHTVDMGSALTWALSDRMKVALDGGIQIEARDAEIRLPDADNTAVAYTRKRKDVGYNWGVSWTWARNAFDSYSIGYSYNNQNSSFKDFEFEEHQVIAAVNLNLDAWGAGYER